MMHNTLDVSVVTYNSEKWMLGFMESLAKQKFPVGRINLFLSDNGSTDNTMIILEQLKREYNDCFNTIYIYQRMNDGFGSGHNFNIAKGDSPFVLVTNVDLEFDEDAIQIIMNEAANDTPNVGSWELRQKPYEHPKDYNPVTNVVTWSSSACILFRRSAFENVGGYEEKIFMYGEDVELSYRLMDRGYILKYIPKSVCWHYAYEHKNQLKKLQFYGSIESNLCLRLRYGTLRDIIQGFLMYIGLFFINIQFKNHRRTLLVHFFNIVKNSKHYIKSRKTSNILFKFLMWDYELRKDGSFYEFYKINENNSEQPLASIIIRTYAGRIELLQQALTSVINQTYRPLQVIIIEDGSVTSKDYVDQLRQDNHDVDFVYQNIPKLGRCHAGNTGLELSRGEFLCFLDDDDLLYADHIEVLASELLKNGLKGAVYSSAFESSSAIRSLNPLVIEEKEKKVFYRQEFDRMMLWQKNYIPIQSILFRRLLFDEHGGFDITLDNLEDWNLWTRYSLNTDFLFVDKTTSLYRVPYDKSIKKRRQREMNAYYQIALEKQKSLKLRISIGEILEYSKLYEKNKRFKTRFVRLVVKVLHSNKFTMVIYEIMRKVYYRAK